MYNKKWGLALALLGLMGTGAGAADTTTLSSNLISERAFAPVYGKTLPPIGFVNFCARHGDECRQLTNSSERMQLTDGRWAQLQQVNSFVNAKIKPVSDQDLYHEPERWEIPTDAGDCEDYVLLKKRYLEGLGLPAESLLITVVLDEAGDGHAVLTVATDSGDFILDNRRDEILRWSETRYQYLKRQSAENPQVWLALTNKQRRDNTISGGN